MHNICNDRSRSRSAKRVSNNNNPSSSGRYIISDGVENRERSTSNCNRPKCPGYAD